MKKYLFVLCLLMGAINLALGQQISGQVASSFDDRALPGASVSLKNTRAIYTADENGRFTLKASKGQVLKVSYIGFESTEFTISKAGQSGIIISLNPAANSLTEVVINTGYQFVAKERATGSFSYLNNALLNRSASTDILSRLEGVTPGLTFDRRQFEPEFSRSSTKLRLRGESSINASKEPLIVLDNFPFEGDPSNINPNDVESITVLKDAAAASIWGARAGNGVIVITTKKGSYNRAVQVNLNASLSLSPKPDLYYNRNFMSANNFIDAETAFFNKGLYGVVENDLNKPILSPVVEILIAGRDGKLSGAEVTTALNKYRNNDLRREALTELYRPASRQQYSLSLNGGSNQLNYIINAGYDAGLNTVLGNTDKRLSINTQHNYKLTKGIEMSAGLFYVNKINVENGMGYVSLGPGAYPYAKLADESGAPLPMVKDYRSSYALNPGQTGMLDWLYRPLQEVALNNNHTENDELRVNTGIRLNLLKGLSSNLNYQYQQYRGERRNIYDKDRYYVRNLVNRFTQTDGKQVFPYGDILNATNSLQKGYNARAQLNYQRSLKNEHDFNVIAGGEIRENKVSADGFNLYGYDHNVLTYTDQLDFLTRYPVKPRGTAQLPSAATPVSSTTDRYVSYYVNGSYRYLQRYTLSGSARVDASNLFGVKTNQKSVPLWSAGLAWNIDKEPFFKTDWLQELKLRATYGYNGNSDNSVTAFVTANYSNDLLTGANIATIRNPGNPQLRWEKVAISNLGIDFSMLNHRIAGSLDYYIKIGKDLLGNKVYDPTAGISTTAIVSRVNYAGTRTNGLDLEINTINTEGKIRWSSTMLFSYASDKVTNYEQIANVNPLSFINGITAPPGIGKSLNSIYSLPWYGLDAVNGDPLVMVKGVLGKDYTAYFQQLKADQLIYHGRSVPLFFGSFRNALNYKAISLSANLTWKAGYYFRRSGINYSTLFSNGIGNVDYDLRWKQPGDEALTQVPSFPDKIDVNREAVYGQSELMVEKGDHIRLQDINLSYEVITGRKKIAGIRSLQVYFFANNLGIIYRANKFGLDPDAPLAVYPINATYSIGLKANLN